MKFALYRSSSDNVSTIRIKSLEELINLMKKEDHPIIIGYHFGEGELGDHPANNCKYRLEIYDDYRE